MMKKVMLILSCLFLSIGLVYSQTITVNGVVVDDSGMEVVGASVVVKGTTTGVATDIDGKFSLSAPSNSTLVFSLVGMKKRELKATADMKVVMENDAALLDEVVVTGVGTATDRRKVAISVESITEQSLNKTMNRSVDAALVGKVAGAQITSTSGQPGQQANIILRGINTLSSTQPMILIDGIEVSTRNIENGLGNYSSRLADLDLSNVDRVEVIQGSAAATIYGAQGANGVIQIFTKRGKTGQKPVVTYSTSLSIDNSLKGNLKFAKNHYYEVDNSGFIIDVAGKPIASNPVTGFWSKPKSSTVDGSTINDKPFKEQTFDHLDQYFKSNALTQNHSINVVGSSGIMDFALGLSYTDQESVVYGDYKKYNVTSNLGAEIFKNFTIRSTTQLISSSNTTGGVNNRDNIYSGMGGALGVPAYVDLYSKDSEGSPIVNWNEDSNSVMPFYSYKYKGFDADIKRVIQGFNLNYKINKFVELDYKYGIDHSRFDYWEITYNQESTTTPGLGISPLSGDLAEINTKETKQNSIASAFIRFDLAKDFDLKIPLQSTTQVAYDWRKTEIQETEAVGIGYGVDPPFTLATASSTTAKDEITNFVTFGYLINQRFDYDNLLGASFGFRSDYSSAFGKGAKASFFPRTDAYFRFSEIVKKDFLYDLKLRFAYGEAGIQPKAYDRLITASSYAMGNNTYFHLQDIARNPNLEVELSKETEFGLDFGVSLANGVWLNKAKGSVVYWTKKTDGAIWNMDTPPSTGYEKITDNGIDLSSDGFQFSIDLEMYRAQNIEWDFGLRFGKSKTKVDKISNHLPIVIGSAGSGATALVEGDIIGGFYGVKPLTSFDETNSYGDRYIAEADVSKYEMVNGYVINKESKTATFTTEATKIGDANPDFTLSFINNLRLFKNLNFSFHLDWSKGGEAYNQTKQWLYTDKRHGDLDKPVNINGENKAWLNYYTSLGRNQISSYFVEDASYLRLRDISLSYDLSSIVKWNFIRSLVISASAKNLFTITDYSGLDPEALGTRVGNPLYRGIDLYSVPNTRSFIFGLNVQF